MRQFNTLHYYKKNTPKSPRNKIVFFSLTISVFAFLMLGAKWYLQKEPVSNIPKAPKNVVNKASLEKKEVKLDKFIKIEEQFRRGDTIINALKRVGLEHQAAYRFFQDVKPVYNLKNINTGKKYSLFLSQPGNELMKFRYQIEVNRYLEVFKDNKTGSFKGKIVTIPFEKRKEIIKGVIDYSLFESILGIGEKPELADLMASLYEYDIDFNRDLRVGDSFSLIIEKNYLSGQFMTYGNLLAAEFINRGKVIRLVRFTDPEGKTAYYHPDGRSARKMFLRCPLPFMRVTSSYGFRRRHPVLGFSARHNGVDFGAPVGTKIRASASGVIQGMGYHRGKGRYIAIRHPNRYVSHYYHLSRFQKGIRRGRKVEQGQIIGYVGSTGISTGPHLHYGLQKNGRFLNPLRLKSPTKSPVKKKYLEDFKRFTATHFLLMSGDWIFDIPKELKDTLLSPSETRQLQSTAPVKL